MVLRQVSSLKKVYHFYTKLSGTGVSTTGALTMLMVCVGGGVGGGE